MSFELEILPSDISNFTPRNIQKFLGYPCRFYHTSLELIGEDFPLVKVDWWCIIDIEDKRYWLYRAEMDDVEPALVYIEGYTVFGKNMNYENIAKDWENNGFSLKLNANDRLEGLASKTFKDLSLAILKSVNGTVFLDDFIPNFDRYGLYDIESWENFKL